MHVGVSLPMTRILDCADDVIIPKLPWTTYVDHVAKRGEAEEVRFNMEVERRIAERLAQESAKSAQLNTEAEEILARGRGRGRHGAATEAWTEAWMLKAIKSALGRSGTKSSLRIVKI